MYPATDDFSTKIQIKKKFQFLLIWILTTRLIFVSYSTPDSKVHVTNMGPTWVLSSPGGPHVGPMNLAIKDIATCCLIVVNIVAMMMAWQETFFCTNDWWISRITSPAVTWKMFPLDDVIMCINFAYLKSHWFFNLCRASKQLIGY